MPYGGKLTTLSNAEKEELLRLAGDQSLKEDMAYVAAHRHNPVAAEGKVDLDRLVEFHTQFNEFMNHREKPFRPMRDREMKL